MYTNRDGAVIGISKSTVGSVGDITLPKERPMPFGKWEEAMHDPDLPESDRCHPFVDRGYQGIADHLPGTTPEIPYKKTRDTPLTPEQKKHNHRINSTRVLVEHTMGRLKRYARLADPYDGNAAGFNREFNVITGLVNLNIVGLHGKGSAAAGAVEDVSRRTGPAPKLRSSRIQGTMKCCKAAHVILDFGVNGLATYTTRAVLGRIFPVLWPGWQNGWITHIF